MMRIADIHCHVLPYVDDGAQDWDESAELLKMQYEQGFVFGFAVFCGLHSFCSGFLRPLYEEGPRD